MQRQGIASRYFFCHLQKTGGTSLIRRLSRHFSEEQIYPNGRDGDPARRVLSISHLLARWNVRGRGVALLTGHFPLCTAQLLGGTFRTFTILREPVDRTLSFLRHRRELIEADRNKSLEEIYEDQFQFDTLIHNHMVKMLSMSVGEMTHGALTNLACGPGHLAEAQRQLEHLDVVGVLEEHEEFSERLRVSFGFELGAPLFINRTRPVAVSAAFRRRIADDNALDVELYQSACAIVRARRPSADAPPRPAAGEEQ
ncbi:MAG TPA: sulfotransferase family 2 domain-containing protein [Vicinamibacterales bacterium]|nr:sulfotransferase family 2 domain-containing protein [Vicinamibacterales bacterium]